MRFLINTEVQETKLLVEVNELYITESDDCTFISFETSNKKKHEFRTTMKPNVFLKFDIIDTTKDCWEEYSLIDKRKQFVYDILDKVYELKEKYGTVIIPRNLGIVTLRIAIAIVEGNYDRLMLCDSSKLEDVYNKIYEATLLNNKQGRILIILNETSKLKRNKKCLTVPCNLTEEFYEIIELILNDNVSELLQYDLCDIEKAFELLLSLNTKYRRD